jgi:hypothetical protein
MDIQPEESLVASEPMKPRPRDKAPERAYNTEVGEQAASVGPGKGGGPVNIGVKSGEPARPDEAAASQGGKQARGKGEGGTPSLAKE